MRKHCRPLPRYCPKSGPTGRNPAVLSHQSPKSWPFSSNQRCNTPKVTLSSQRRPVRELSLTRYTQREPGLKLLLHKLRLTLPVLPPPNSPGQGRCGADLLRSPHEKSITWLPCTQR